MRDSDIRSHLWGVLEARHMGDDDTLMLNELSLAHGTTRIDLAVINGEMQGYELKSDRDTLERLSKQSEIYSKILDRVTLVLGESHYEQALVQVPTWWGISVVTMRGDEVQAEEVRPALQNVSQYPIAVAQLLWREEAIKLLEDKDAAKGVRSKPREAVYERLCQVVSLYELKEYVRRTLKDRHNWRADQRRTRCDGLRQSEPKFLNYQDQCYDLRSH